MTEPTSQKDTYVLSRTEQEIERLNIQHDLVQRVVGCLIQDEIHISKIHKVLDAATGTGVFLRDLANSIFDSSEVRLEGCDISEALFPYDANDQDHIDYYIHDILNPFPLDHHGYDFVFLRFVIMAFNEKKYQQTFKNIYDSLNPGGWLQIIEIDPLSFRTEIISTSDDTIRQIFSVIFNMLGRKDLFAPSTIFDKWESLLTETNFTNIKIREFQMPFGYSKESMNYGSDYPEKSLYVSMSGLKAISQWFLAAGGIDGIRTQEEFDNFYKIWYDKLHQHGTFSRLQVITAQKPI